MRAGKPGFPAWQSDDPESVFFRLLVVHVDARGPGAAGGEVPGQAGQGDQLVKLPGGRAAVPGEVKPTEGVAEEVHEGDRVGDVLSGVFNANEGELVQGLACEGPGRGAIRASLVAGAAAWPAIFAIVAIVAIVAILARFSLRLWWHGGLCPRGMAHWGDFCRLIRERRRKGIRKSNAQRQIIGDTPSALTHRGCVYM